MTSRTIGALREYVQRTAIWMPALTIGLVMMPLVVTQRTYGPDWTLHLWAIKQQEWNIRTTGHPALFVSVNPLGAFYPLFPYVGSGIYTVGALLGLVIGALAAYKLLILAGLCMGYGGFTWLAIQFGLRGWRSQVPGAVLVTGAYFLTDLVGRGDFGEFIALAAIPLVLAAGRMILTAPVVRTRYRLALLAGAFVFTGSHNITLLWGTTFIVVLLAVAAISWWPSWRSAWSWARVGQAAAVAGIGAGLNAWYLLPDLATSLDTRIGRAIQGARPRPTHVFAGELLDPLRSGDTRRGFFAFFGRDIRLSLPILFLGWAAVLAIVLWRGRDGDRAVRRLFVGLVAMIAASAVLVAAPAAWSVLPHVYWSVQFTYRMDGYVLLGTALLVLLVLVWDARAEHADAGGSPAGRSRARWGRAVLAGIVLFSVGIGAWQVWTARSWYYHGGYHAADANFADVVTDSRYVIAPSWYSIGDFLDVGTRTVAVPPGRALRVPVEAVRGTRYSGSLPVPDGPAPFVTNIAAGPNFVRMQGITAVGRDANGFVVATRARDVPSSGPVRVSVGTAMTAPIVLGALVSLLCLVLLVSVPAWPRLRRLGRR